MSLNIPLVRPTQSQVKIEPTAKTAESDGFTYPTFRLLNKQARTAISSPYELSPNTHYHLLAIANSKGWFAGARFNGSAYELVLSPLEDLRSASKAAKVGDDNNLTFKRTLSLGQSKPNILTFAKQDSHLIVALEEGTVVAYDTTALFTPGEDQIQPTHTTKLQTSAIRQIAANPGTEANLVDRVAIVGDGFVSILNMQLEPQGGWTASDPSTIPAAVAWSPKGKHIAIGLQTGDILTFALTNMTSAHKHIPPTFNGSLVSLSWTGPGHTFRTGYASPQEPSNPGLHIVSLDTKSNTGTYYSLNHPFVSGDRSFQSSYLLQLPKWDEDTVSSDHSKTLFVFGDSTSVDLEVLAHDGGKWFQQSQENQISLPLNKDMDDTTLLSLDLDLTETSTSTPIAHAFLNDGTLQSWHLEHSKPYPLIVNPSTSLQVPILDAPDAIQSDTSMSTEQDQSAKPPASSFVQPSAPASGFGQSAFGGTQAFGSGSAFGQPTGSTGFSAFSSTTPVPFGQGAAQQQPGSTSPFGSFSANSSTFGGSPSPNAFSAPSTGAFSSFGSSNASPAFGQAGFGSGSTTFGNAGSLAPAVDMTREASMADATPGFGGMSLGSSNTDSAESKPSIFGSFNSGASNASTSASPFGTASSSVIKPATAFGFANNADSVFSKPTSLATSSPFSQASQSTAPTSSSAFGKSGFGQSGFGQASLTKPAFGQPAFGQSGFTSTPTPATSTTGSGFGAFANKPTSFSSASQPSGGTASTFGGGGGFSAFAGSGTNAFTAALKPATTDSGASASPPAQTTSSTSPFGSAPSVFGNTQSAGTTSVFAESSKSNPSVFGDISTRPAGPAFGGTATQPSSGSSTKPSTSLFAPTTPSPFGGTSTKPPASFASSPFSSTPAVKSPIKGAPKGPPGISSPPSSPELTPAVKGSPFSPDNSPPSLSEFRSSQPPVTSGAFANLQTSPSIFRPASGFNAFGGSSPSPDSPFFQKHEQKAPVSVFSTLASSGSGAATTSPVTSSLPAKATTTPTFGTPSLLGAQKALFPPTPPSPTPAKSSSGGFSAFSGPPASLSVFGATSSSKSSFTDLLKTGDGTQDPIKPQTKDSDKPTPVFGGTGKIADAGTTPQEDKAIRPKDEETTKKPGSPKILGADTSFGDLSSAGSSFVDIESESKQSESRAGDTEEDRDEARSISDDYGSDESYEPGPSDDDLSDDHVTDEGEEEESLREEGEEEEEEEGEENERETSRPPSPEPTAVPLPPSRSNSATPQPEVPNITVTPSGERSGSTTPPGTPDKETNVLPRKSPSPSPTSPGGTPPPFAIGLGRPSTRPARSSPLASAPLSGDDEAEESKKQFTPKLAPAELPAKIDGPKVSPTPSFSPAGSSKSLTMPSTPVLAHAKPPVKPVTAPLPPPAPKTAAPSQPLSLFGSPTTFGQPPIFGQAAKAPSTAPGAPPSGGLFGNLTFPPAKPSGLPVPFSITPQAPGPAFFGTPPMAAGSAEGKAPTPFDLPTFNLGGQPSKTPPTPASSFFGAAPSTGPAVSFFGSPSPPAPAVPTFNAPPSFGNLNFNQKAPQSGDLFGSGSPTPQFQPGFSFAPKAAALPKSTPSPAPPPPPELTMEEGMQKECALLIMSLNKELEELRLRAQQVNQKRQHLSKSAGGSWNRADLGDSSKWALGDLRQFAQVLPKFGEDLTTLKEQREKVKQDVRELNTSMLKANTRREEIARFNKAKTDPEFAKMLKTRTLGPEHSETQTQLRRGIRAIRDRITKLESNLQASKKKLAESASGRPSIKAPTLDTVNRTFRNIEIALSQQASEVAKLVSRCESLDLNKASLVSTPSRDSRLPDRAQRRPYNVTPNVAATTAAALNAERGAHRLKKALLAVRSEPLLNANVNASEPPPVAFSSPQSQSQVTPQRPAVASSSFTPLTPFSFPPPKFGGVFTPPNASELPDADATFSLPVDEFSPWTSLPSGISSRRGGGSSKKHSTVQLPKKSPGPASTSPAPSFDWGPLPSFNNSPMNSLAASFTKKA